MCFSRWSSCWRNSTTSTLAEWRRAPYGGKSHARQANVAFIYADLYFDSWLQSCQIVISDPVQTSCHPGNVRLDLPNTNHLMPFCFWNIAKEPRLISTLVEWIHNELRKAAVRRPSVVFRGFEKSFHKPCRCRYSSNPSREYVLH